MKIRILLSFHFLNIFLENCENMKCYYYSKCISMPGSSDNRCICPTCLDDDGSSSLVCASDGRTYTNQCWMKRHACLKQIDLVAVKPKACGNLIFFFGYLNVKSILLYLEFAGKERYNLLEIRNFMFKRSKKYLFTFFLPYRNIFACQL